jgi:peptidylprolyl isomerase
LESKTISNGNKIKVEYIAYMTSGQIVDQSKGNPLEFVVGSGELIKGFDEAVVGMKAGEEKTVTVPPEKAYGVAKGAHPMGGQTMIFWIKIVEIK